MDWLNIFNTGAEVAKMVMIKNPIAMIVIKVLEAVVEKTNDGISNQSMKQMISTGAKSAWNTLDEKDVQDIYKIIDRKVNE